MSSCKSPIPAVAWCICRVCLEEGRKEEEGKGKMELEIIAGPHYLPLSTRTYACRITDTPRVLD